MAGWAIAASGLSASLLKLGFELKRLKTGTPPRLLKKSIDFSRMELQHGDQPPQPFSYHGRHACAKGGTISSP